MWWVLIFVFTSELMRYIHEPKKINKWKIMRQLILLLIDPLKTTYYFTSKIENTKYDELVHPKLGLS